VRSRIIAETNPAISLQASFLHAVLKWIHLQQSPSQKFAEENDIHIISKRPHPIPLLTDPKFEPS